MLGTRIEPTGRALLIIEERVKEFVPEATTIITQGGSGGNNWSGGGGGGGNTKPRTDPPHPVAARPAGTHERTDRHRLAPAAFRLAAWSPRSRQPIGRQQPIMRFLSGGGTNNQGQASRLQLEIRGHDLDDARRVAQDVRTMMEDTPGIADVSVSREEGRPEIAIRVDRPKAAMLGMTVQSVASTIQTNVAGTTAAQFRERGNEYPVVVRLREADREEIADVGDVLLSTPTGQVVPAKNVLAVTREAGPTQIQRKNMERVTRVNAEIEIPLSDAVEAVQGSARPGARAAGFLRRLRSRARGAGAFLRPSCARDASSPSSSSTR